MHSTFNQSWNQLLQIVRGIFEDRSIGQEKERDEQEQLRRIERLSCVHNYVESKNSEPRINRHTWLCIRVYGMPAIM